MLSSPRLRGEVDRSEARSGEGGSPRAWFVEGAPHPDPIPASGEREIGHRCKTTPINLRLEILRRREIARIDRLREERLFVVGPELTHIGIGLDHGVRELAVFPFAFADEHPADYVSEMG